MHLRNVWALVFGMALVAVACARGNDDDAGGELVGDDGGTLGVPVPAADASSFVGTSRPACEPRTCAKLGAECGPQGDGCGGLIQCGTCTAPTACGGGGVPNQCGG